jgi:hypothetical protein
MYLKELVKVKCPFQAHSEPNASPSLTPVIKHKTLKGSETPSTSHSDEPLNPLMALEGLMGLEDQENHQTYPPLILFLSNLPMT